MIQTALVGLHHKGVDAGAVVTKAKFLIRNKVAPASAYDQAVQSALNRRPEIRREIERNVAQVKASDDATVAAYDSALSAYITSGDRSALAPVERMAVRDAVQFAIKNKDLSAVDVQAGRIDFAKLGMDAALAAAAYSGSDSAPAQPGTGTQTFAFAQPGAAPPKPGNAAAWTPTGGYSPGRASAKWQSAAPPSDVAE